MKKDVSGTDRSFFEYKNTRVSSDRQTRPDLSRTGDSRVGRTVRVLDLISELSSNKEPGNLSIVKPSNGNDGFLIVSPHPINPVYNTILTVLTGSG